MAWHRPTRKITIRLSPIFPVSIHILIPLVGFAGAAIFVQLLVSAAEGWHLAMMMAAALAGLQIGYLAGAAFRSWEIFHLKDQQRDSEKPEADNESLPIN
jgi:hypothetical protein